MDAIVTYLHRSLWRSWLWVACLLTASTFSCSAHHAKDPDSIKALKLTQTHIYWGKTEVIVSMDGIRIDNKGRMFWSLVAHGPDWVVTLFRDDDKTYLSQSLKSFEETGLVSNMVIRKQARQTGPGHVLKDGAFSGTPIKSLTGEQEVFEYIPLKNIAAPQVERIIYTAYKLPTNGAIPVRLSRLLHGVDWMTKMDTSHQRKIYLATDKIEPIVVSKKIFDAPKGYTPSKSIQTVLINKVSREASGDIDELFEIGKSSKKNEHH